MNWASLLAAAFLWPGLALAQNAIPAGTLLAVSLGRGLNVNKLHPGQEIRTRIMQSVPGTAVHRGAHVLGKILAVDSGANGSARLEMRFDAIESHGRRIPVRTNVRAIASMLEVEEAQIPEEMSSRGLTPETWTTQQIGGDQVYRGGGPVTEALTDVGTPGPYGVLATPRVRTGEPCRAAVNDNNHPQALWLFSADACGVYGISNLRIVHAGRTAPVGTIILSTERGKLNLRGGSALLLRVQGS
jgi:hypothetical protein